MLRNLIQQLQDIYGSFSSGSPEGWSPVAGLGQQPAFVEVVVKIASVDPGGRTGLVLLDISVVDHMAGPASRILNESLARETMTWRNIEGSEEDQCQKLYQLVRLYDVVVIEDFQLPAKVRTRNSELLSPVRIGFGLSLLLGMSPRFKGKIVWQQPTQMGVITDDRLRAWGLWLPGEKNKDIRSAMKHLLIYLRGQ